MEQTAIKAQYTALGPGITDERIAAAEVDLDARLPEAYRNLLRSANGCMLPDAVFYMPRSAAHPKARMEDILLIMGVGHTKWGHDLVVWNKTLGHRLPAGALQFASDSGGNGYVVFVRGPRLGEVAFRDHESPDELTTLVATMDDFFTHIVPADAPEVLADFPPLVGTFAKKVVARKAKGRAAAKAPKGAATRKVAAPKIVAKKGAPKAKKAAPRKVAAKKSATKRPTKKTATKRPAKTTAR